MCLLARCSLAACFFLSLITPSLAAPVELPRLTTVYFQPTSGDLPSWAKDVSAAVADVLKTFMAGLVPDPTGAEIPNVRERPVDQYVKRLNAHLGVVLQGAGNLKVL